MTTTAECPGRFDVAIDGVGFMLDEEGDSPALVHQSIRQQREQSVAQGNIGEATVNPEGFWRRSIESWSHGAGQSYYDRAESNAKRFRDSRGVDVFADPHSVKLLRAVESVGVSTSTEVEQLRTSMLGSSVRRVYYRTGSGGIRFLEDDDVTTLPWAPTVVTGGPATVNYIAVGGGYLYAAGADGVLYRGTTGSSTVASYGTGQVYSGIAFVLGRLMTWQGPQVFNVTAGGAAPAALFTAPDNVYGIVGAGNHIYIGTDTRVYKTTIEPDGTALGVPTSAGELPAGETIVEGGIFGYLNFVFVSTTAGVRMAAINSNGDLEFGSVIPYVDGVHWAAKDRFVWVGGGVDDADVGLPLLKMDLTVEIAPNTPAYAYDLSVADDSHGRGLTVFRDRLIMSTRVDGGGDWAAYIESDDTYVTSGYIESGLISHDIADHKSAVAVDVEAGFPDDTSIVESLSTDRGATFTIVGTVDGDDDAELAVVDIAQSRNFELKVTLAGDGTDTPTLYRHTLKVEPGVSQGDYIIMRLRLYESVIDNTGSGGGYGTGRTPNSDLVLLEALQASREVVQIQEGDRTYTGTVRDLDWQAHSRCAAAADGSWNGVATIRIKKVAA